MSKKIKNKKNIKDKRNKNFWAAIVLLVIMVLSIAGFALSGRNFSSDSSSLPDEIPFQQFEDPDTGTIFWGAIRGGEQFIFTNITGYDNRSELSNLAGKVKIRENIDIYTDESFDSKESIYFLNKALNGLKISTNTLLNQSCNENTLVLTTNSTDYNGDCMVFNPELGEEYKDTEILVYHMIQ